MNIFGEDVLYGNVFRASDFGLIADVSFSGAIDESNDMFLAPTTNAEFLGGNSHATFLSQKYEGQQELTISFTHNPCLKDSLKFTEHEVRAINRVLTGKKGYDWLKVIKSKESTDTDYYYYATVSNISYQYLGDSVVGVLVTFKCDGGQAYSEEQATYVQARAGQPFYVYNNSDELYDYTRSVVTIIPASGGTLEICNVTDNMWYSTLENCSAGERIVMDCKNEILTSSTRTLPLNDFNLHWIRLLPDKNEFTSSLDATITFKHRVVRKTGFID